MVGLKAVCFGIIIGFIIIIILIASTGFFDRLKNIRLAPTQTTDVNIRVNSAPTIVSSTLTGTTVTLDADTTKDVTFTFVAEDTDGAADLSNPTATAQFTKTGEATRTDTLCDFVSEAGNQRTYTCTVTMQYFDDDGTWTLTASINDQQGVTGTGVFTFTVALLKSIGIIGVNVVNFPIVVAGQLDITATDVTLLRNEGNFNTPIQGSADDDGDVQITATNLIGQTIPAENIPAANFRAGDTTESVGGSNTLCVPSGTGGAALSTTAVSIASIVLPKGAAPTNRGTIEHCLKTVPAVSSQVYSATVAGGNAWIIGI